MKTNHTIHWIRIALLCMAMALILSLMTIPLLAKGIAYMSGNTLEPDKLDIRPIPAPRPPLPSPNAEPAIAATPAPPLAAAQLPQAIPVPTPPTQVMQPDSSLAQSTTSHSAPRPAIRVVTARGAIAGSLMFILLLLLMWWRRASSFRSLHQECAS